jgi:hypothetical protein
VRRTVGGDVRAVEVNPAGTRVYFLDVAAGPALKYLNLTTGSVSLVASLPYAQELEMDPTGAVVAATATLPEVCVEIRRDFYDCHSDARVYRVTLATGAVSQVDVPVVQAGTSFTEPRAWRPTISPDGARLYVSLEGQAKVAIFALIGTFARTGDIGRHDPRDTVAFAGGDVLVSSFSFVLMRRNAAGSDTFANQPSVNGAWRMEGRPAPRVLRHGRRRRRRHRQRLRCLPGRRDQRPGRRRPLRDRRQLPLDLQPEPARRRSRRGRRRLRQGHRRRHHPQHDRQLRLRPEQVADRQRPRRRRRRLRQLRRAQRRPGRHRSRRHRRLLRSRR